MSVVTRAMTPNDMAKARAALLAWYDVHARALPWRRAPADRAPIDPYRVWLSEVMLQQTTTAHAAPYFEAFTRRWPTVADLAAAPDADILSAWAGLGYYARARNLIACARAVVQDHGGVFPGSEAALRTLPGLGAYAAAAIAAIAFDEAANVVDANVERVMARLFAEETPLPEARAELRLKAGQMAAAGQAARPGDYAQALMDLGAMVCRPREAECLLCPLAPCCEGRRRGEPSLLPVKPVKAEKPLRTGAAFVLTRQGQVARVRRPDKGLLGAMLALPSTDWKASALDVDQALAAAPVLGDWRHKGVIDHVFTHFRLELSVFHLETSERLNAFEWEAKDRAGEGMPTVFSKALARGLS